MVWWCIWCPYRVIAMKHFESKGMIDSFTFKNAKNLKNRKEYDALNIDFEALKKKK